MDTVVSLDKDDEKFKMDANELLLKAKGFMLFAITEDGELESCSYSTNLNRAESLGFKTYINQITSQLIENATSLDLDSEDDDSDDEDIQ